MMQFKRMLSVLLILCMTLTMMPREAWAAEAETATLEKPYMQDKQDTQDVPHAQSDLESDAWALSDEMMSMADYSYVVYISCNVQINTTAGLTVNLYRNLGDAQRATYFNQGQTAYSTYRAHPSDGSVWYQIQAIHQNEVQTFWLNAASPGVEVIDLNVPPSMSFSPSSLSLSSGSSSTVSIRFAGTGIHQLRYYIDDSIICSASWGSTDWDAGTTSLTITGLNAGSTEVRVAFINDDGDIFYSDDFNVTVYHPTYSLYYNSNGGSGSPSSQQGSSLTLSATVPSRFGYDFLGWSKSASAVSPSFVPGDSILLTSNTTLYAVWRSAASVSLSSLPRNDSVSMNIANAPRYLRFTPSSSGKYSFQSTGSNDTIATLYDSHGNQLSMNDDGGEDNNFLIEYNLNSGLTYYLKVSLYSTAAAPGNISISIDKISYTAQFNANGGSGAPSSQSGTNLTVPSTVPSRFGYDFLGWNTSSSASAPSCYPGESIALTSNITLYAIWKSASTVSLTSLPFSTSVSMNIPNAPRYLRFVPSASGKYSFLSIGDHDTIGTLYDSRGNKLTENDDGGDGSNFLIEYNLNAGSAYYLKVSMYSSSAAPGNVSISISKAVYTVRFNAGSGNGAPSDQSGTDLTLSKTIPSLFGYDFLGWSKSSGAGTPDYYPGDSISLTSNITLYAVWREAATVSSGSLPSSADVSMNIAGAPRFLRFTPSSSGSYLFQSTGSSDTIGTLYDAHGNQLATNDNGGSDSNFLIEYELNSGSTYYLKVTLYSSSAVPGKVNIFIGRGT